MRVRSKSPPAERTRRRRRASRLKKSLTVCLLPLEEDARFQSRHEVSGEPVGQRFDVIKNYLLLLINSGRRALMIQGEKRLDPGEFHVIEKYTFDKFDWFTRYRLPFIVGRRGRVLVFDIPDHIPGEEDYRTAPVIGKKAYFIAFDLERG